MKNDSLRPILLVDEYLYENIDKVSGYLTPLVSPRGLDSELSKKDIVNNGRLLKYFLSDYSFNILIESGMNFYNVLNALSIKLDLRTATPANVTNYIIYNNTIKNILEENLIYRNEGIKNKNLLNKMLLLDIENYYLKNNIISKDFNNVILVKTDELLLTVLRNPNINNSPEELCVKLYNILVKLILDSNINLAVDKDKYIYDNSAIKFLSKNYLSLY